MKSSEISSASYKKSERKSLLSSLSLSLSFPRPSSRTTMVTIRKQRCFFPSATVQISILYFLSMVISANAIRCYQCNSHYDDYCTGLDVLRSGKTTANDKFLQECAPSMTKDLEPFCRKISMTIEHNNDHRIIRSCGYTPYSNRTQKCLTADNEGYIELVCQCFTDGCNTAESLFNYKHNLSLLFIIVILIFQF